MDAPAGHSAGITPQPAAAAAAAANVHRGANTAGARTTSSTQQPPSSDKSSCSAAAVADNAAPAAAGAGGDAPASTSSLAALGVSRPVYVFHQRALEAAASTTSRCAVQTWPLGGPREASVTAPARVLAATAVKPDVMLFMLQSAAAWFVSTCSDGASATRRTSFFFWMSAMH